MQSVNSAAISFVPSGAANAVAPRRSTRGCWRKGENSCMFRYIGFYSMITIEDLYNIVGKKIANETGKAIIRNSFPPHLAEQMCQAIDGQERAEHFQRLLKEYNEWLLNQQRQQAAIQSFLQEYYK